MTKKATQKITGNITRPSKAPTAPKPGPGRPTLYTPELGTLICEYIVDDMTIRKICAMPGMPDKSTLFRWLAQHDEFATAYARARELQMDVWADDIREIADDSGRDLDPDAEHIRVNSEFVQRSKLRVDTRKWLMTKRAPKRFGNSMSVDAGQGVSFSFNVDLSGAGE